MTLKEAVKKVINQNIDAGYTPHNFIKKTENGEAENLEQIVIDYVLDKELDEILCEQIEDYQGKLLLIEDLIVLYGFNLPENVIREAQRRVDKFKKTKAFFKHNQI